MLFDAVHMVKCKLHGSQLYTWVGRKRMCSICVNDKK